jgi:hypothetical protein
MKTTLMVEPPVKCDLCKCSESKYDAKTKMGYWAYMCKPCYKYYGIGTGLGKGQQLIKAKEE